VERVESVIDLSKKNPYIPMPTNTPMRNVLQKFIEGIHRIPVVDNNGQVIYILSQMALFKHFFNNHTQVYETLKQKTVKELNLGHTNDTTVPYAVREDELAIDAFKQITDNGVSAVGILDSNGNKLIGVLSASDLQGFLGEELHLLGSPVLQFKQYAKQKLQSTNDVDNYSTLDPVIFCKNYDTLETVVDRFAKSHVHRIFVMDDDMRMTGVISLTDLFQLIHSNT
jgi:5'-AMP-activated protein kinase regulatory gamma subunit